MERFMGRALGVGAGTPRLAHDCIGIGAGQAFRSVPDHSAEGPASARPASGGGSSERPKAAAEDAAPGSESEAMSKGDALPAGIRVSHA